MFKEKVEKAKAAAEKFAEKARSRALDKMPKIVRLFASFDISIYVHILECRCSMLTTFTVLNYLLAFMATVTSSVIFALNAALDGISSSRLSHLTCPHHTC